MKKNVVRRLANVAIFGAIATILYVVPFFSFSVPFLPSFLSFHFDELPIFIAGFAFGPLEASLIIILKTLIKLPMTHTAYVGELSDLIYSFAFILPASLIYRHKKTLKTAIIGTAVGFMTQLVVSTLGNVCFMIDFYINLYGITAADLLASLQAINGNIVDLRWSLAIYGIIPFNVLKDLMVIILTFLVYKRISRLIERQ